MARHDNDGIYQRKDGRYATSITLGNHKRKYIYGKTKQEVREKRRKALREQELGRLATGPKQSVKDYLEYWLEVHKQKIRIGSYVAYRHVVQKHLIPGIGQILLQKLTPQHIQDFYLQKSRDGMSPRRVKYMHVILHRALEDAVRWERIPRNVCDATSPPRFDVSEMQVLTVEQSHTLLEAIKGSRLEALVTTALATGMREGELLSLRWQDLDLEKRTLYVRRTVATYYGYGWVEGEPKTKKSKRKISLPQFVIESLKRHQLQQGEARKEARTKWQENDLVFPNINGAYEKVPSLLYHFKKMLKKEGLPNIRFHDLRHSAATIMLTMGIHPKIVQEILGHSNFAITMNLY